jgi:hypothetical protein
MEIVQMVARFGRLDQLVLLDMADQVERPNDLYIFLIEHGTGDSLRKWVAVPDPNGNFRYSRDLSNGKVPQVFTSATFERFGIRSKEQLVYGGITTANLSKTKGASHVGKEIARADECLEDAEKKEFTCRCFIFFHRKDFHRMKKSMTKRLQSLCIP